MLEAGFEDNGTGIDHQCYHSGLEFALSEDPSQKKTKFVKFYRAIVISGKLKFTNEYKIFYDVGCDKNII